MQPSIQNPRREITSHDSTRLAIRTDSCAHLHLSPATGDQPPQKDPHKLQLHYNQLRATARPLPIPSTALPSHHAASAAVTHNRVSGGLATADSPEPYREQWRSPRTMRVCLTRCGTEANHHELTDSGTQTRRRAWGNRPTGTHGIPNRQYWNTRPA
jgi:hypothetical protein